MEDELIIFSGLDQSLPVNGDFVLEQVELSIQRGIKQKNALIPLNVCKQLIEVTQLAGLGLAKTFYLLEKNWDKFETDGEFDEIAYEYLGKHSHTVERYVKVWRMFDENIAPKKLQQKSIGELIPIGNAIAQGYEISDDQWEELSEAPDPRTVRKIIREDVKHQDPRKSALQLFLTEEGSITVIKAGEIDFAGSLNIQSESPIVQQAIERIIKNSGMLLK